MSLSLAAAPGALAVTLHVDASIKSPGDGLTWATGMNDLQAALTAAAIPGSGVTEIRVAQGTYLPTVRTIATDPRSVTFRLVGSVALRGGYAGISHADPDEYLPSTYVTALTGDIAGDDATNGGPGNDNSYHVLLADAGPAGELHFISGLTITGGNANMSGNTLECRGGGLCVDDSSYISLTDCVIANNRATLGGGLYKNWGYTSIQNSKILSNRATTYGAGMLQEGGNLVVNACEIAHNVAEAGGGGGVDTDGNYTIENSTFMHNYAGGGGGGVRNLSSYATGTLTNCLFSHNVAVSGGAANVGSVVITRCTFEDNTVAYAGGAVIITNSDSSGSSTIARSLF
ncbi:MAG TPA: right-handed parallel beta-helix repeat-containing protein, partial [Phycisphaerales bacterium]|nr:right-handed parallel beta-helix repeat-containing protein [Phycisphaerales bacterium]